MLRDGERYQQAEVRCWLLRIAVVVCLYSCSCVRLYALLRLFLRLGMFCTPDAHEHANSIDVRPYMHAGVVASVRTKQFSHNCVCTYY